MLASKRRLEHLENNLPDEALYPDPGVPLACAQGHGHLTRLYGEVRTAPSRVWTLGSCFQLDTFPTGAGGEEQG